MKKCTGKYIYSLVICVVLNFKNQNMKNSLMALLLFGFLQSFAQETVTEKFKKINTVQEAQQFIDANQALKPALLHLSYGKDSSLIDKRLLRQNKGDIFSVGYVTYKVLEAKETVNYRANYIFLDGSSLTPAQIDSLKKIIVQKASAGAAFDKLSDEYTMDGNTAHGDTGWFFGEEMMPKEFQDAVKNHNKGDIFFVDVPEKQWHYIVKKTYDDDDKKDITVLRANGR
jgi:parvulin-like peptidyl-prolyl isomerase